MHFIATVRKNSFIARDWRGRNHIGGNVDHVHFRWDGRQYVSGQLTPEEYARIQHNPQIEFEAMSVPPPEPVAPPLPITDDELFGDTSTPPERGRRRA
jgi:hypothetical protein